MAHTPIPHEAIAKLAAMGGDGCLSSREAAYVLDVTDRTVQRAVSLGKLEAVRPEGQGHGVRGGIRIPRAAVIAYLVKRTTGDRAALMSAIERAMPRYLDLAKSAAGGMRPLPANAIDGIAAFKAAAAKKRKPADIAPGHPDLFANLA